MASNSSLVVNTIPLSRPEWLPKSVWPFETFGLKLGDLVLAVTDVGRGPVLLFVHAGMWSFLWRDIISRLSANFRCICFDVPGTGRSSSTTKSQVSLERAAHSVTGLIESLDLEKLTLVVHDLGGLAGLAGVTPIAGRVRGLVAMNTFGWKPVGNNFRGMLALMGSRVMREIDVLSGFLPQITASNFGIGRHLDAASRRAFLAGMTTQGRRSFHDYVRDARHCDTLYDRIAGLLRGSFNRFPLLTVFGELNDPFGFQQKWKELFANTTQVVVPKGHHFPMCDAPELVTQKLHVWHRGNVGPLLH